MFAIALQKRTETESFIQQAISKLDEALQINSKDPIVLEYAFKFYGFYSIHQMKTDFEKGISLMKKLDQFFQSCFQEGFTKGILFEKINKKMLRTTYERNEVVWKMATLVFYIPQLQGQFTKTYSQLEKLGFSGKNSHPLTDHLLNVALFLMKQIHVKKLHLSDCSLSQESFFQILKACGSNLTHLSLFGLNLESLEGLLLDCPNLEFLSISNCQNLSEKAFSTALQGIAQSKLSSLALTNSVNVTNTLLPLINSNKLTSLDLRDTSVTDEGLDPLKQLKLIELNLAGFFF